MAANIQAEYGQPVPYRIGILSTVRPTLRLVSVFILLFLSACAAPATMTKLQEGSIQPHKLFIVEQMAHTFDEESETFQSSLEKKLEACGSHAEFAFIAIPRHDLSLNDDKAIVEAAKKSAAQHIKTYEPDYVLEVHETSYSAALNESVEGQALKINYTLVMSDYPSNHPVWRGTMFLTPAELFGGSNSRIARGVIEAMKKDGIISCTQSP